MPSEQRRGWLFGALLVLVASGVVLIAEIVAARVIAPYVGLTLETFSAVVGCVLAGISAGAYTGGWLADRVAARTLLTGSLALGGVALLAAPTIVRVVGPHATASESSGALTLAAAAFLLPSIALSMVPPTVLKSLGQGSTHLGSVAGAVSAIGTAGALLGNFGAGFVLVGALRTSEILVGCGAVCLVLAGATALLYGGRPARVVTARSAAAVVLLSAGAVGTQMQRRLPCDAETKYVCLRIVHRDDGYLFRSNIYASSLTDPDHPTRLAFKYVNDIAEVVAASVTDRRSLAFGYIGGGGYTLPLYFEASYPASSHTVFEIDSELADRVMSTLGISKRSERFATRIGDARTTLVRTAPNSLDVIIGDAFSGLAVPYHLTTREFLADVDTALSPDGIYVMNVIDHRSFAFARAEARTFQRVFDDVVMIVPSFTATPGSWPAANILVLGGARLPDVASLNIALGRRDDQTVALAGPSLERFIGTADVLTDEFAPVDQLIGDV